MFYLVGKERKKKISCPSALSRLSGLKHNLCLTDMRYETGDLRHETGYVRQETGNRSHKTGNMRHKTGDMGQET